MNYKEIKKLFKGEKIRENSFDEIDTFYIFTNENINGYLPNVEGKDILSVASSGDHYFNLILKGANNVDLFDINYLVKFIINLKKIIIEKLDYESYLIFFGLYDMKYIFNYNIYLKVRKYLDEETSYFWDYLYCLSFYEGYNIYKSYLIYKYSKEKIFKQNEYLTEENYIKLKEILPNKKINFIHSDINNLKDKLDKKYDMMFFSNISLYQKNTKYIKVVKKLSKHLKQEGLIYFAYLYYYKNNKQHIFFDELLKSKNYTSKIFKSESLVEDLEDKVYIYKNVKK